MIKVENIETWGFEHAIRGMRNPLNSWGRSDTKWRGDWDCDPEYSCPHRNEHGCEGSPGGCVIGVNDSDLMRILYKAGSEHRKFMRQIFVSMDITAPLYWWKEFDTYKIGTTANSCSTMHTIHKKPFELDNFSHEHLDEHGLARINTMIRWLNEDREEYVRTKDKSLWYQIIQLLPESYNQKRTVTMNYENAVNMINQRKNHKLDEWREFVGILRDLPHLIKITGGTL